MATAESFGVEGNRAGQQGEAMCEDLGYVGGSGLPLIYSWGLKTKGNGGIRSYTRSPDAWSPLLALPNVGLG